MILNKTSFLFLNGQICRVLKDITERKNVPFYWNGAKVKIISRTMSNLNNKHIYKVLNLVNSEVYDMEKLND